MPPQQQITDPDHMLPRAHKPVGPLIAIIVILALLIAGALYFYGSGVRENGNTQVPYIPASTTTLPTATTTE